MSRRLSRKEEMFGTIYRLGSLTLVIAFLALLANGETLEVRASRFIDGDTFGLSVRLIGVDAPETRHPRKAPEPLGKEASLFLRRVLAGKTLRLEFDEETMDRYGRLLAYVYLPDGTLLNALLVCEGYARASPRPPNLKYAPLLRQLEEEAREAKRGLWRENSLRNGEGKKEGPAQADGGAPYGSQGCREKSRK